MKITKKEIIKKTACKLLMDWDYSHIGKVISSGFVIDLKVAIVKFVVFFVQLIFVITIPISVFIVVKIGRMLEIRNLMSWVRTMRRDRDYFYEHHYIEIKRLIKEHEQDYYLTMNWQ